MKKTQVDWFDVDLSTLRLQETSLDGWPQGMTRDRSRMQEECLESVVALNLDALFPGEDLLLMATQSTLCSSADVMAIDPFGFIRLMELKKTPAKLDDLHDQVIGYGLSRDDMPSWNHQITRNLIDLPEQIALSLEGFRVNQRAKSLGGKYVQRYLPVESWRKKGYLEKARLVADALRASRGAPPGPDPLQNPIVAETISRLYGVSVQELIQTYPDDLLGQILQEKWNARPTRSGTEFLLVAPEVRREAKVDISLKDRGAYFHLIDADLRCTMGERGVERAVLRWQPVRRTLPEADLQTVTALRRRLQESHPEAAALRRDPGCTRFRWGDNWHMFLRIEEGDDGSPILVTRADGLTEGLAYLRPARARGLKKLRGRLLEHGVWAHTPQGELAAPWDRENLEPAVELATAYYDLLKELDFFNLDVYAWGKRPQSWGTKTEE